MGAGECSAGPAGTFLIPLTMTPGLPVRALQSRGAGQLSESMNIPLLGPNLPKRGNCLTRALGRILLGCSGWRIEGEFPDRPKLLLTVAPHTSNWDFLFGIGAVFALGLNVNWLAKDTLFSGPWRRLLEGLGGIPVNRREPQGTIEALAGLFQGQDKLTLCITPEGTRKRVDHWKTGFYRIALQARVPLVLCSLDYGKKTVGIGPMMEPAGDFAADFGRILDFYRTKQARYPDRFNPDPETP